MSESHKTMDFPAGLLRAWNENLASVTALDWRDCLHNGDQRSCERARRWATAEDE